MIWFTSDLHFFHDRILEFHPKRKEIFGSTVEKAKEAMIQLWNSRVNKKDTVYILGDLAFGEVEDKRKLFQRLNGNKVLILGNHDKVPDHLKCYFNHITQIKNIKFKKSVYNFLHKDLEVIMCHFPMLSWEHKDKGSVMIHGHCHGKVDKINTDSKELRVDVGIDGNLANYDLISLEKLANHLTKIEKDNEQKQKYETEDAVIKAVCENVKVDIPSGMIETETEDMLRNIETRLSYQGLKLEQYLQMMGKTAEEVKKRIGTAWKSSLHETMEVSGRDLVSGLPTTITLNSDEIAGSMEESLQDVVRACRTVLEQTPPELASDIVTRGIVLTGGGALLKNLDTLMRNELMIPVYVAENALRCVAEGTGILLENLHLVR